MSEAKFVVGPVTVMSDIEQRARELGTETARLRFGSLAKGGVHEWVGVDPPEGEDGLNVNLAAPDAEGREPSIEWGYVRAGRWSWDSADANSCFNHTDLVAIRVETQ